MSMQKIIIAIIVTIAIIAGIAVIIYRKCGQNLINFSEIAENDNWDELSLTIYYLSPGTLTLFPIGAELLADAWHEQRIVVYGNDLREHADLLLQLDTVKLIPVAEESRINARIYYVFETKGGRAFRVAMWGAGQSLFVNGREVEEHSLLYDVLIPFLPEGIFLDIEHLIR